MTTKKEEEMTCAHNSPTYLHLEKLPASHTLRTGLVVSDGHPLGHRLPFPPWEKIRAVNTFTRKSGQHSTYVVHRDALWSKHFKDHPDVCVCVSIRHV